ncbi:uncharacterized protein METZ01_LOCUS251240, partial [marine metagenome]
FSPHGREYRLGPRGRRGQRLPAGPDPHRHDEPSWQRGAGGTIHRRCPRKGGIHHNVERVGSGSRQCDHAPRRRPAGPIAAAGAYRRGCRRRGPLDAPALLGGACGRLHLGSGRPGHEEHGRRRVDDHAVAQAVRCAAGPRRDLRRHRRRGGRQGRTRARMAPRSPSGSDQSAGDPHRRRRQRRRHRHPALHDLPGGAERDLPHEGDGPRPPRARFGPAWRQRGAGAVCGAGAAADGESPPALVGDDARFPRWRGNRPAAGTGRRPALGARSGAQRRSPVAPANRRGHARPVAFAAAQHRIGDDAAGRHQDQRHSGRGDGLDRRSPRTWGHAGELSRRVARRRRRCPGIRGRPVQLAPRGAVRGRTLQRHCRRHGSARSRRARRPQYFHRRHRRQTHRTAAARHAGLRIHALPAAAGTRGDATYPRTRRAYVGGRTSVRHACALRC